MNAVDELEAQIKELAYRLWQVDGSPQDPERAGEFLDVAAALLTDEKEYGAFQGRIRERADKVWQDDGRRPDRYEEFRQTAEKMVLREYLARWRRIQERAYFIWVEAGCPEGFSKEHWAQARKIEEEEEEEEEERKQPPPSE